MCEAGIGISAEVPKVLTAEAMQSSDLVVTMGCGDVCPSFPGTRYPDRPLNDPAEQGFDAVRPIRDAIERHVRGRAADLGGAGQAADPHRQPGRAVPDGQLRARGPTVIDLPQTP
jgi:hypothetical protein